MLSHVVSLWNAVLLLVCAGLALLCMQQQDADIACEACDSWAEAARELSSGWGDPSCELARCGRGEEDGEEDVERHRLCCQGHSCAVDEGLIDCFEKTITHLRQR